MNNKIFYSIFNDEDGFFDSKFDSFDDFGTIALFVKSSYFKGIVQDANKILFVVIHNDCSYILDSFDLITSETMDLCEDIFSHFLNEYGV